MNYKASDLIKAALNEPKAPESLVEKTVAMAKAMELSRKAAEKTASQGPVL